MKIPRNLSEYLAKNYGEMIGRGTFSHVYHKSGDKFVTIISNDRVKECAAYFGLENTEDLSKRARAKIPIVFPRVEFYKRDEKFQEMDEKLREMVAEIGDGDFRVYKMDYLSRVKSPKRELNPGAWAIYQKLRKISNSIGNCQNNWDRVDKYRELFNGIEGEGENKIGKNGVGIIMNGAIDRLLNYGADIGFEISPRNISTDKAGRLILMDCFFFRGDLK